MWGPVTDDSIPVKLFEPNFDRQNMRVIAQEVACKNKAERFGLHGAVQMRQRKDGVLLRIGWQHIAVVAREVSGGEVATELD